MLLSFFEVYFSKYCCLLVFLFFTSFFWKKVVVYGFFVGFVSFLQGIIDCFRNYSIIVDFRKLSFLYYQALSRGLLFFLPPLVSVAKIADIYRYHEIL